VDEHLAEEFREQVGLLNQHEIVDRSVLAMTII
jgi:hypothetical protein